MKRYFFMALAVVALTMPSMAQEDEWHYTQGWMPNAVFTPSAADLEDVKAIPTPQNMSEIVAKMPALPTVEQIYSIEAKEKALRTIYEPYSKSLFAALELNGQVSQKVDLRIQAAGQKQQKVNQKAMAQYNANVNAGLMPSQQEMMEMMMSGEINPNWSEDKIMDAMAGKFAAKWGVSKQEYLKIIGMAQKNEKQAEAYLKSNHPDLYNRLYAVNSPYGNENVHPDDPRTPAFDRISDELSKAQEDLTEALNAYGNNIVYTGGVSEYATLFQQMEKEWDNSPEAKQIEAIEAALQKRIDAWYLTLKDVKGDIPYPDWYTTERRKENALIDQWNKRWATLWLKIAQEGDKKLRSIFEHVADLDAENEQLGKQGDTEEFHYLMNKKLTCSLFGYVLSVYSPVNDAISFPCIEHVADTGFTIIEK